MSGLLLRDGSGIERVSKAEGGDLVVDLAFASEIPYERWWGIEVLRVTPGAVRLDRLNDGAAVLYNHDPNQLRGVHVKGSVRIDADKVLRGKVRLEGVTQAGRDTIELVRGEVLTKTSVGYRIHQVEERTKKSDGTEEVRTIPGDVFERTIARCESTGERSRARFTRELDAAVGVFERGEDAPPVYIVTDWEPHENSLVTVPADPTVGVDRSLDATATTIIAVKTADGAAMTATITEQVPKTAGIRSAKSVTNAATAAGESSMSEQGNAAAGASAEGRVEITRDAGPGAVEMEAARVRGIENLAKANSIDEGIKHRWISGGTSIEKVSEDLLAILKSRGEKSKTVSDVGLSAREVKAFSITRAIRACADQNWGDAGLEAEASREIAKRLGAVPDKNKFYVPAEIQKRDLTVGTTTAGGFLVETANQSFIEMLRNTSVAYRMGVTNLSGLQGSVTIPRQTAAATAAWLANEAATAPESQQTFGQLALSPKTVGAYTEISRQLLLQSSPSADGLVQSDLAQVVGLAVDLAVLNGSGASGQPTGIINTAGIGSVTGTSIAYAGIVEFQTDTASGNALFDSSGYVTTPAVAGLLKQRVKFTSTASPIWEGKLLEGSVDGYRAMASNQVPSANILFGDFSKVVLAEWGVLQVEVNPYANFQAGIVGVRAMYSIDVGVRYAAAFSLATGVT